MIIFLSGPEAHETHVKALLDAQAPSVLSSFFYARNLGRRYTPWLRLFQTARTRLADSGAFTFRTSALGNLGALHSSDAAQSTDFDKYLDEYVAWVDKHRRVFDYWIEVDIAAVAGSAWVKAARDKFIARGLGHGLINVWHSDEHDWSTWLEMIAESKRPGRSRYVAIEGHTMSREQLPYGRFLRVAYEQGVRVHAFKVTSAEDLRKWPFYSVDSTTWSHTVRNGTSMHTVPGGGVRQLNRIASAEARYRAGRPAFKGVLPRNAKDTNVTTEILCASAKMWIEAERHITEAWKVRGIDWDAQVAKVQEAP